MASGVATVKASVGLNVRKGPGTGYAKLGCLSNGTRINFSSEQNGWLQVKYSGKTGYISKQYTSVSGGSTGSTGSSGSAGTARVTASAGLNVRKGPGTGYAKLGVLANNTTVSYSGEQNGWLKITYAGKTGYISKQYTTKSGGASSGGSSGGSATQYATVTCTSLNVRSGAGTGYARLGSLSRGQKVAVYSTSGSWLQIAYGSGRGWIHKGYTNLGGGSSGGGSSSGATKGSANAQKVVNWANNHVGACYKRNGMTYCQGYVADCVQYGLGRSYARKGSAEAARQAWAVSSNSSNIPLGAAVYLYSYTTNGRKYGHVGIHVGGNMICHVTGNVVKQSLSQINNSGWCKFRSWGWEGGIPLN